MSLHKTLLLLAAWFFVAIAGPTTVLAQAPASAADEAYDRALLDNGPKAPEEKKRPTAPATPWAERLHRELGPAAQREDTRPLVEIVRRMKEIEDRMATQKINGDIERLQAQVLAELDLQIREAKQSASAAPATSEEKSTVRAPTGENPKKPDSQTGGTQTSSKPATASQDTSRKPEQRPVDIGQSRSVLKKLWGELPERQRDQMLELPVEEFLPKYDVMIEAYFRKLSQEQGRGGGRP